MALSKHAETRPEIDEIEGPSADGDPMGTPAANETVLWKGRPNLPILTRTTFHTRSVALYFVALIAISLAFGNANAALVCAVLGVIGLAILQFLAWLSARSTLYILTDARLIMRIGMAIETRINIPLKHIGSAHLKPRDKGHGDIALEIKGERLLGWLLLWPHTRPFRYSEPQPMMRSIPEAQKVASLLADAVARHEEIERNLIEVKESGAPTGDSQVSGSASSTRAGKQSTSPAKGLSQSGLEGAPA